MQAMLMNNDNVNACCKKTTKRFDLIITNCV